MTSFTLRVSLSAGLITTLLNGASANVAVSCTALLIANAPCMVSFTTRLSEARQAKFTVAVFVSKQRAVSATDTANTLPAVEEKGAAEKLEIPNITPR